MMDLVCGQTFNFIIPAIMMSVPLAAIAYKAHRISTITATRSLQLWNFIKCRQSNRIHIHGIDDVHGHGTGQLSFISDRNNNVVGVEPVCRTTLSIKITTKTWIGLIWTRRKSCFQTSVESVGWIVCLAVWDTTVRNFRPWNKANIAMVPLCVPYLPLICVTQT